MSNPGIKRLPVAEIFGPTIQGEGPVAGLPSLFIRFGGCDYRCSWCDSLHAVDPIHRETWERLTAQEIRERVRNMENRPALITLTGGNPAAWNLTDLVRMLQSDGHTVLVETQGSIWREWLREVDWLIVSPKPPSALVAGSLSPEFAEMFLEVDEGRRPRAVAIKVVVFDGADLEFAQDFRDTYPHVEQYLSVGTHPGEPAEETLGRARWIAGKVLEDAVGWERVHLLPQLHVLLWGHGRGV